MARDLRDWLMEAEEHAQRLYGIGVCDLCSELPGFDVLAEDPEDWVLEKGEKYGLTERDEDWDGGRTE